MARYIDKDELLKFIKVDLARFYPTTYLTGILAVARDVEKKMQPVEVVPRDEHLFELKQAKQEVVDEVARRSLDAFPEANRDNKCPAIYYDDYRSIIEECSEELKKKYIGE